MTPDFHQSKRRPIIVSRMRNAAGALIAAAFAGAPEADLRNLQAEVDESLADWLLALPQANRVKGGNLAYRLKRDAAAMSSLAVIYREELRKGPTDSGAVAGEGEILRLLRAVLAAGTIKVPIVADSALEDGAALPRATETSPPVTRPIAPDEAETPPRGGKKKPGEKQFRGFMWKLTHARFRRRLREKLESEGARLTGEYCKTIFGALAAELTGRELDLRLEPPHESTVREHFNRNLFPDIYDLIDLQKEIIAGTKDSVDLATMIDVGREAKD